MDIQNTTPFPSIVFESVDANDMPIHVVVLRGTFAIGANQGEVLTTSESQEDIVLVDSYYSEPLTSSVKIESDLVPRKNATDITFNGSAMTNMGVMKRDWDVVVRVGVLEKIIMVCGPRFWRFSTFFGWQLTEPQLTNEVPIRYELAYGGDSSKRGKKSEFRKNPVGRGRFLPAMHDLTDVPGPQIWDPATPILRPDGNYDPAGLGPIAKHWEPRIRFCGTADKDWEVTRWPLRPLDFCFSYYSCSSQGMQYPGYVKGDEMISLSGVNPSGPIVFYLPSLLPVVALQSKVTRLTLLSMRLDTVHIDTNKHKVCLTWRLTVSKQSADASIFIFIPNADKGRE